jgi:hypothetical protein
VPLEMFQSLVACSCSSAMCRLGVTVDIVSGILPYGRLCPHFLSARVG